MSRCIFNNDIQRRHRLAHLQFDDARQEHSILTMNRNDRYQSILLQHHRIIDIVRKIVMSDNRTRKTRRECSNELIDLFSFCLFLHVYMYRFNDGHVLFSMFTKEDE
jgi:hypothetical protein